MVTVGEHEYLFEPTTRHETNGALETSDHAHVRLGGLTPLEGSISLDATSTLEIGNTGTAAAGTVTVDPGATLSGGPSFALSNVVNNSTITSSYGTLRFISGPGLIEVAPFLQLGPGVGSTVHFGSFAPETLDIGLGAEMIDTTNTPLMSGVDIEDTIGLLGVTADSAQYVSTGTAIGTLTLDDGGTPVANLTLPGTYTSDQFAVTNDGFDTTLADAVLIPIKCPLNGFANGGAIATLHPSFASLTWEASGCAPLVVAGPVVAKLPRRLQHRAIALRRGTDGLTA